MKKTILLLFTVFNLLIGFAQNSTKPINTLNTPPYIQDQDPNVLISCEPLPSGTWRVLLKDSIKWEFYNVRGLRDSINNMMGVGMGSYIPYSDTVPNKIMTSFAADEAISKIMDSIDTKVYIDDTSSMLNPYLRKTQAQGLYYPNSNPNGFITSYTETDPSSVHISDTASMLTPYLKKNGNGNFLTGLTKSQVGLENVDNTADANKNVLSATKLATPRNINGVSFDGTGNITIVDATKESLANKQNSLAVDGTGTLYPTVDAVNQGLSAYMRSQDTIGGSGTGKIMTTFSANNSLNGKANKSNTISVNGSTQTLGSNPLFTNVGIELPSQTGQSGKFLQTNGSAPSWQTALTAEVDGSITNELQTVSKSGNQVTLSNSGGSFSVADADSSSTNEIELPSQTGQSGKVLSTNGSTPSWVSASTGTVTSVTAGTGLSGGTITGSGTISLPNTGTAGTYGRVTTDAQGRVTAGKRQETYSGTTDASGLYTVTFGTAYSVAPNIQAQLIGGTDLTFFRIVSVSTTGFQVYAFTRSTVNSLPIIGTLTSLLLGAATNPLLGSNIDVLITEK